MALPYKLDELKATLENLKTKADRSKVQEEYLLNQLKNDFEIETMEEAIELKEQLEEEYVELEHKIDDKIQKLLKNMESKGLTKLT